MLDAAHKALAQLWTPPFRTILVKSLGLTLLILAAAWYGLETLGTRAVHLPYGWMDTALAVALGLGLVVGMIFLVPPVSALVAGFFLDDIAAEVERAHYPADPPGRPMPAGRALVLALRFTGIVLLVNLLALLLLLVPVVNLGIFFVANAYLLGREYFELAAMRHLPEPEARALRRANAGRVFVAGLVVAALAAVPLANLLTPLFGTAFMVHVFKDLAWRTRLPAPGSCPDSGRYR